MGEEKQYLNILKECLEKKTVLLERLLEQSNVQAELTQGEKLDVEAFDKTLEVKADYIEQLNQLDEGFQSVYERISQTLKENPDRFSSEIGELQRLIQQVTDLGVKLQVTEQRNKDSIERSFHHTRRELRKSQTSVQAASRYYQSMSKTNLIDPQLMDQKK